MKRKAFDKALDKLGKDWRRISDRRQKAMAEDPNNGKKGWWRVSGVRHNALVRASSALEAVEKVEKKGAVGSWEYPSAEFIGTRLPDVVEMV